MATAIMDLFVVEYSISQKAFNLCSVREMLDHNCRMILSYHTSNDYLVVGIAETYDAANALLGRLRELMDHTEFPAEITYEGLLPS